MSMQSKQHSHQMVAHKLVVCMQTVLQSDKDMGALLGTNHNFERWIKHGFKAEDLINSSNDSEEALSQGSPPPSSPPPAPSSPL